MSDAPNVSINKGKAKPSSERIVQRVGRLKQALAKPSIKPEKKSVLEAELAALTAQANELRASLEGV